jgi:hypothetical protein
VRCSNDNLLSTLIKFKVTPGPNPFYNIFFDTIYGEVNCVQLEAQFYLENDDNILITS